MSSVPLSMSLASGWFCPMRFVVSFGVLWGFAIHPDGRTRVLLVVAVPVGRYPPDDGRLHSDSYGTRAYTTRTPMGRTGRTGECACGGICHPGNCACGACCRVRSLRSLTLALRVNLRCAQGDRDSERLRIGGGSAEWPRRRCRRQWWRQRRARRGQCVAAAVCVGGGGLQRAGDRVGRGGARDGIGRGVRRPLAAVQWAGAAAESAGGNGDRVHAPHDERRDTGADHRAGDLGVSRDGAEASGAQFCHRGAAADA